MSAEALGPPTARRQWLPAAPKKLFAAPCCDSKAEMFNSGTKVVDWATPLGRLGLWGPWLDRKWNYSYWIPTLRVGGQGTPPVARSSQRTRP